MPVNPPPPPVPYRPPPGAATEQPPRPASGHLAEAVSVVNAAGAPDPADSAGPTTSAATNSTASEPTPAFARPTVPGVVSGAAGIPPPGEQPPHVSLPQLPDIPRLSLQKMVMDSGNDHPVPMSEEEIERCVGQCCDVIRAHLRRGKTVVCASPRLGPASDSLMINTDFSLAADMDIRVDNAQQASLRTKDGVRLKGDIVSGEFSGQCELYVPEEGTFFGEMSASVPHGKGMWVHADDTAYEGSWRHGKRHGVGTQTFAGDVTFSGEWKEGQIDGQGVLRTPGMTYEGEWRNNARHGLGVVRELATTMTEFHTNNVDGQEIERRSLMDMQVEHLQRKVAELEEKIVQGRELREGVPVCIVCMERNISRVVRPCGHCCLCGECADRIISTRARCPMCRGMVRRSEDVMLP